MCNYKSLAEKSAENLADYYSVSYTKILEEIYKPRYLDNGFDHNPGPIITAGKPNELQIFHWGLVPFWVKDLQSAVRLRTQTLNCISEEMWEKPSFKDAIANGQRCLIPCTGFFEWHWNDEKGKTKIPHYIYLKDKPLFSIAGLYSRWKDKERDQYYYSYTVLTTEANKLMSEIHNTKKRMPVIIPAEYEKDWLNPNLAKDDVKAFCQPLDDSLMTAYTISKLITTRGTETNVKEVLEPYDWNKDQKPPLGLFG